MQQAEEDLIVMSAQHGSHKAFNQLVNYYQKPLLRFAYKISGDKELASDAVQEGWIKVAGNIRQLNDPRAFRSWLYRTVRWRVLDILRKQKKLNEESTELLDDSQAGVDWSINYQSIESPSDSWDELRVAINNLPAIEKQIIHLFYLDEMKLVEISTVLEIPVGTVKSRLNRARRLLKQKFE